MCDLGRLAYPVKRLCRSSKVFKVVKEAGWKRVKEGWRIVLRSGKFCVGGISGRNDQYGFSFGSDKIGLRSVDARSFGGYASLSFTLSMFLYVTFSILAVVDSHKRDGFEEERNFRKNEWQGSDRWCIVSLVSGCQSFG
ncbi:hypothetical protein V6N13_048546 [Hibiscus sabdariffa]|uniref:Transmembrane protein n=1 Tax=Hibiscus sabdariffa TaxID=183260 RepID=A0ABR2F7H6_9ROSI